MNDDTPMANALRILLGGVHTSGMTERFAESIVKMAEQNNLLTDEDREASNEVLETENNQ